MYRLRMESDYIKEYKNTLPLETCRQLIEMREQFSSDDDIVYWSHTNQDKNLEELAKQLHQKIAPKISEYFESFHGLADVADAELKGFSIIRHAKDHFDDLHYDTPIFNIDDKNHFRPFICLIYLNHEDFVGGQVIFPVQKYILEPEAGKLALFPTSFQFPHMVSNISGGDRYSIRFTYEFDADPFYVNLNKWDAKYSHEQRV